MLCLTPPLADSRGQAWKQRGMCTHLTGTSSDKQKAKEPDSYQQRTADAGSLFLEARAPFFKIKSSITFKAGGRQDFTSHDFSPFIQRLQMDFFYSLKKLRTEKITRQYCLNYTGTHTTTMPFELHTGLHSLCCSS